MGYKAITDSKEEILDLSRPLELIKHTEGQEARSIYYDSYYSKTGAPAKPVNQKRSKKILNKNKSHQIAISEEVNRLIRKASETVNHLIIAEDFIDQANYAFAYQDCLEELWQNRNNRENNWGDLLNIIQIVLAQVEFEHLSKVQKLSIQS